MPTRRGFDHSLSTTLVISIVYPLGPAAFILMPMIVGGLVDNYGYTEQQAANISTLEGIGLVIASLLASVWIRRFSWIRALALALGVYAAGNVLSANLDGYLPLLITRFMTGLAGGSVLAVAVGALGDNREPDRAFGLAQAVQGVMMLVAFSAAPYLLQTWGVHALYYLLAIAALLMFLSLLRFPAMGISREAISTDKAHAEQHTGLIWVGLIASGLFFLNVFGFWAFVERIGQAAQLPAQTIGLALGVSQILAVAGALAAAIAGNRFGRYIPLLVAMFGQCAALFALVGSFGSTVFFISTGIFQALFMLGVSYQMGAIAKLDVTGRYLVVMTAVQSLGAAVAPTLAAALIETSNGYTRIMALCAALCVLSMLTFLIIVFRSRNARSIAEGLAAAHELPSTTRACPDSCASTS